MKQKKQLTFYLMLLLVCFSQLARGQSYTLPISGPTTVCIGSYSQDTVPPAPNIIYYWTVTAGGVLITANPCNPAIFEWVSAGTATITVVGVDNSGNHIDSGIATVTVVTAPSPFITTQYQVACQSLDSVIADTSEVQDTAQNYFLNNGDGCIKVCDSTAVKYTANGPAGSSFTWLVTGGTIVGSSISSTVLVLWGAPGSGSLTLVDTLYPGGCVGSVTICFDIIEKPHALFEIAPETGPVAVYTACQNTALVFTDLSTADVSSPIVSWTWIFGDGTFAYDENPTHTYATAGTYDVDLVVKNACGCTDTFQTVVTVSALQGPDVNCASVVCETDTQSYYTSVSCGGAVYNWSVVGGTIISGIGTASITVQWAPTTSGFGYVSLAVLGCYICPDTTTIKIPIVESNPVVTGPPSPICDSTDVQYSIPLWPGVQYYWGVEGDPGAVISEHNSNVVALDFTSAGVYIVHVWWQSRTNLCGGDKKFKVVVNAPAVITGLTLMCQGSSATYALSPSSSATWILNGPGGFLFTATGSTFNPPPFSASGDYTLSVSGAHMCTPSPLSITVQPTPLPPASISGPNLICYGAPNTYSALAPVTGENFYWTITPASSGTLTSTTGSSVIATWTAPGTISVAMQGVDSPYCTGNALSINVAPFPLNPYVTGPDTVCPNTYENYMDNYFYAESTIWAIYPDTAGSVTAGIYDSDITVLWNNTTVPVLAALVNTIIDCDSIRTDTLWVYINSGSPVSITGVYPLPPYCNGTAATFTATPGAGSYSWTFGDGGTGSSSGNTISHDYVTTALGTSPITDIVTVTASGSSGGTCFSGSDTDSVAVYPGPYVTITTTDPVFYCTGGPAISTTFYATVTNYVGPLTYQWYNGGSPVGTGSSYTTTTTGDFWVQVTDGGIPIVCPVSSNDIPVTTAPCTIPCVGPTISITYTQSCDVFSLTGSMTGTSPTWAVSPGYSSFTSSGYTASVTYPNVGQYHVFLTEASGLCLSTFDGILTVPLRDSFTYSILCSTSPYTVKLVDESTVYPGYSITSISWNVVGVGTFSGTPVLITTLASGTSYTIIETVTVTGGITCSYTQTITTPIPTTVDFTDAPNPVCEGLPVAFTESIGGSVSYSTPVWDFGDGSGVILNNPDRNFTYDPTYWNPNLYIVTMSLTNHFGCVYSVSHTVTIFENNLSGKVSPLSDPIVTCGTPVPLSYLPDPLTTAPTSYLWSNGPPTPIDVVTVSGSYFVTVHDAHDCQFVTAPRNVLILPPVTLAITGTNTYCHGETVILNDYIGSDYSYQWYRNGVAIPGANSGTLNDPSLPVGIYTYWLTVGHTYIAGGVPTGCTYTSPSYIVTINPLPPPPFVSMTLLSCSPYSIELTASSGVSGATYTWSTGGSGPTITVGTGGPVRCWLTDLNGCQSSTDTYVPPSPETFTGWVPVGCYTYCNNFLAADGLTLYGPPGVYPFWQWLMNGLPDGSGTSSVIAPLVIAGPGDYQLSFSTGYCTATMGNMNVSEKECQCPTLITKVTIVCDPNPEDPAGYLVTFVFYNPYSITISGTIGMDIGPLYAMPASLPPGTSTFTYSFTTLDVPPPLSSDGWFHFYYPGGDCEEQFKLQLPSCSWIAERQSNGGGTGGTNNTPTSMLVYPNPAQNEVTISYNYGIASNASRSIVIYDVYGRVLVAQAVADVTGTYTVQLNDMASGNYLVRMQEDGHTVQIQHLSIVR